MLLDVLQEMRPRLPADLRAIHRKKGKAMARQYNARKADTAAPLDEVLTVWHGVANDGDE